VNETLTYGEAAARAARTLTAAEVPDPVKQARDLLAIATGKDAAFLIAHPEAVLSEQEAAAYDHVVSRRSTREPFQHIAGKQEFYGLEFLVSSDVMIPRPETELVVEAGIDLLKHTEDVRLCEIGVGSGCIIVSLLRNLPGAKAVGLEISRAALEVASENARRLGVSDRLELVRSDLYDGLGAEQVFDLIVSNPPYVPVDAIDSLQPEVRDFEPLVSLTDGGTGLSIIGRIIEEAPSRLSPGGHLLLEIGFSQSPAVLAMFDPQTWDSVSSLPDLQGIPRMIKASLSATYGRET